MERAVLWVVASLVYIFTLCAGCIDIKIPEGPYVIFGEHESEARTVSCDLRIVRVADGTVKASASGRAATKKLKDLAEDLADALKDDMLVKGVSISVVSLRNRSGTKQGQAFAEELADKLTGALLKSRWFNVKERIDLRSVLNEKDLEDAALVKRPRVRQKLAGIKYIISGGVTTSSKK